MEVSEIDRRDENRALLVSGNIEVCMNTIVDDTLDRAHHQTPAGCHQQAGRSVIGE